MRFSDIEELIRPILEEHGAELVDIEVRNRANLVRVYVDKPGGITLDECANIHRTLFYQPDRAERIPERFTVEISSPGIGRPFKRRADYQRNIGKYVEIKTREQDRTEKLEGTLVGVTDDSAVIEIRDKKTVRQRAVPLSSIVSAKTGVRF